MSWLFLIVVVFFFFLQVSFFSWLTIGLEQWSLVTFCILTASGILLLFVHYVSEKKGRFRSFYLEFVSATFLSCMSKNYYVSSVCAVLSCFSCV